MHDQRTRFIPCVATTLMCGLCGAAQAVPQNFIGDQDPVTVSSFTLDFLGADFGDGQPSVRTGDITTTSLGYRLDFDGESARLVRYRQDVQSLILPYGTPTGAITVAVVPGSSSSVSFVQDAAVPMIYRFETSELYSIAFENDLSAYGFPGTAVSLPGNSNGVVDFAAGTIQLSWEGDGAMLDPSIPGQFIIFHYTCSVNTRLVPRQGGFDVSPGSCSNLLDRSSGDPLSIELLGTGAFDASMIDPGTIEIFRADGVGGSIQPIPVPEAPTVGAPCGCSQIGAGEVVSVVPFELNRCAAVKLMQLNDLPRGAQVEWQVVGRLLDGTPFTCGVDCVTIAPSRSGRGSIGGSPVE